MGAGQPIKGSGNIRPRPPVPSSDRETGVGAENKGFQTMIGGLQQIKKDRETGVGAENKGFQTMVGGLQQIKKDRDEQRNAANGAFRDNDRRNTKKAPPKPPRGPGRGPIRGPRRGPRRPRDIDFRRPGRGPIRGRIQDPNDPTRYNEPRLPNREPDNTVRPAPTDPEPFRRPRELEDRFQPYRPWEDRIPRDAKLPDFRRPIEDRRPIQRPGRPGIMPIPDKFRDPDGNPYKQPGRGPKDLQRQAVEDRMRKSKAQSKGGRKVNNAGGRW